MSKTFKLAAIALAAAASVAVVASAGPADGSRIVVTGTRPGALKDTFNYDSKSVVVYFGVLSFANPADRVPIAALVAAGARTACARPYDHIRDMKATADRKHCVDDAVSEAHAAITPNIKVVAMTGKRFVR
jgi:hypothetical protein